MKQKLAALTLIAFCFFSCNEKNERQNGLSPKEALASFQLPENFKIELVASEPMISDPVAMEVDENGDIYVVEMHGYPLDTAGSGIIKLLTDTNDDGMPDKAAVFADHLKLPTGVMKWKKGILVTDVPDIIYLEDSDNDGKADIRKTIITGFAVTNPQHIANTPVYGLDNWIYVAHQGNVTPKIAMKFNDPGSNIRFTENSPAPQLPRDANGRNVRFKPGEWKLEMLSGESQYGQTFDNWGHHLCTSNADHLFHEVLAARYIKRNPALLVAAASAYIPDHGNACEIYPATINPRHQLLTDVGVVTSSSGVTWYQGGLFPDSFNNVTFIAEPVHNLVHADRIIDNGATFTAKRVYEQKEFLTSTDAWSRPVQFYIGPDGALYMIDYYRQIIEHPEWMSEEVNNSGALYNGSDKGRIYRITPSGTKPMNWCSKINLYAAPTAELVRSFSSSNIWWRRHAQRLLLDRNDSTASVHLKNLLDSTTSAIASVHALWALEGLRGLDPITLQKALRHRTAGVRENAIRLAELHFESFASLQNELLALQKDPDPKVRFQLLCTLGDREDEKSQAACGNILMHDIEDNWVQIASLSSTRDRSLIWLEKAMMTVAGKPSEGRHQFFKNCATVTTLSANHAGIKKIIQLAANANDARAEWWQSACLEGLNKGLRMNSTLTANMEAEKILLLSKYDAATPPLLRKAAIDLLAVIGLPPKDKLQPFIIKAKNAAADKNANAAFRSDALGLLAFDTANAGSYTNLLASLVAPDEPENLQQDALLSYNELAPGQACAFILQNWKMLTPSVRSTAMDILLSSPANMSLLLDGVEKKTIQSSAISWPGKVHLMNNDDETIRSRARLLLATELENRDEVYRKYLPALGMKGDAKNGLLIFDRVCANCHQSGGQHGKMFGPDLASVRNRDAQFILMDILNPNRAIADKFEMRTLVKKNGESISGILSSETGTTVTLTNLGGLQTTVVRNEIKKMEASETSAMPAGLEAAISLKEMADLLAFLKGQQ